MKKGILLAGLVTGVVVAPSIILTKGSKSSEKANVSLAFAGALAADKNPTDECQTAFKAVIDGQPKAGLYTDNLLQVVLCYTI